MNRIGVFILFWFSISMTCFGEQGQRFPNCAKDNGESSYIKELVAWVADGKLILRFEGELLLGRKMNLTQKSSGQLCDHVDTRLIVKLSGENLENYTITVGPDKPEATITIFPENTAFAVDANYVEIIVPLDVLKFSPVEINAEMDSSWYLDKTMIFRNGRNLYSSKDGMPVVIFIDELPIKPELPKIVDLQVDELSATTATLKWQTNNYTNAQIHVKTPGRKTEPINYDFRSKAHQTTLTGLVPDANYTVEVSGTDFAGRKLEAGIVEFKTRLTSVNTAQNNAWLSVKGKFIVDSQGNPFPLGGYSHYVGEYWHNEFPRYGTLALTARHFKSMGFNACRLGLVDHKEWWAASIMREGSGAFDLYGDEAGYVKKFLRPMIDQIIDEGVYVIIDWHWSYEMDANAVKRIGNFWEACAKEFKDEPRVAMYQLLNEPSFSDIGGTKPELAPRLRTIVKEYIERIRKYDTRHIILVPDWNSGWGDATESQWAAVNFDPGDKYQQIVYSKHISSEHLTEAFMKVAVDQVVDKRNVPVFFDEVENSTLMSTRDTGWFFNFLKNNPRKYGFLIWVCGQYPQDFIRGGAAFSQYYLPVPPFTSCGSNPIVGWWRLKETKMVKKAGGWFYHYKLPAVFESGDYGVVVEGAPLGTVFSVAVSTEKNGLIGTQLGVPDRARWTKNDTDTLFTPHKVSNGQSAAEALYWHALEPFTEVVIRIDRELGDWNEIQLIRLNPKHQMPVPTVKYRSVEYESIESKIE